MDIVDCDAVGQAELVRTGQATPSELVQAAIEVVERRDSHLAAIAVPTFEQARRHARVVSRTAPFPGVPTMLKDYGPKLRGYPRPEQGLGHLSGRPHPSTHSTHVARGLADAGFAFLARSTASLLATDLGTHDPERAHTVPRNPWDPTHAVGGSSSGSATAVAARMVPLAHGNDGGGSLRMPAALCGAVALKPSRGLISAGPDASAIVSILNAWVSDFVITRSVRDAVALLELLAGRRAGDPTTVHASRPAPATPLRVGLTTTPSGLGMAPVDVDPDCVQAAEDTARLLADLGHDVVPVVPPRSNLSDHEWRYGPPAGASPVALARDLDRIERELARPVTARDVGPALWSLAEFGRSVSALQAQEFAEYAQRFCVDWDEWWEHEGLDLLLTPTVAVRVPPRADFLPPPLGTYAMPDDDPATALARFSERLLPLIAFTQIHNVTGRPAITLPLHVDHDGLPVGVQLAARHQHDRLLLAVARDLEAAHPWRERTPARANLEPRRDS